MSFVKSVNWHTLPGADDITRVELSNGIIILTRSNFNSSSVSLSGYLPSGSLYDPQEKLGMAYFTGLSLMRGTVTRSFQDIYDELESVGASLGFGASVHNTNFGGRALAEDLPILLGILSESLSKPNFPVTQLERLRAQLLTGLAIRAQSTGDMASLTFDEIIFRDHPYGRPVDGYPESVQSITREDLIDFHRKRYGPRGMVIVVVGGVNPAQVVDQVQRYLGDWHNPEQEGIPKLPFGKKMEKTIRRHIEIPGKSQINLIMGTIGPKRNSKQYLPASLGNNILGQFGMMGRIGDVVREQSGLAYHASTSLNSSIVAGSWEVSAGVNPANLQQTINLILQELNRFVGELVSVEELQDSQSCFIGRLPLSMESNAGVAGALLNLERFNLGLDYYRQYPKIVKDVTVKMVLETAANYLDTEKLAIISAGTKPNNLS